MTEAETAAGKNILDELSTSDDADEIAMLSDAYHGLIVAACMRLGIVALSSREPVNEHQTMNQTIGSKSARGVAVNSASGVPTVNGETQAVVEILSSEIGALQHIVSELIQRLSPVLSGGEVTVKDNIDGAVLRNCALSASIDNCKYDIIQTRATISAAINQLCI